MSDWAQPGSDEGGSPVPGIGDAPPSVGGAAPEESQEGMHELHGKRDLVYDPETHVQEPPYVPPSEYNMDSPGVFDGGAKWRYYPEGTVWTDLVDPVTTRWRGAGVPPQGPSSPSHPLTASLQNVAAIGDGELPLAIHDSLQQLRSQLLDNLTGGGVGLPPESTEVEKPPEGRILAFQMLDATCVRLDVPGRADRGHGKAQYFIQEYTGGVKAPRPLPRVRGVNSALNYSERDETIDIGHMRLAKKPRSARYSIDDVPLSERIGRFLAKKDGA